MAYSPELKAEAIALIQSNDGIITDTLIAVIRQTLGADVSQRTLYNWYSTSAIAKTKVQVAKPRTAKKKTEDEKPVQTRQIVELQPAKASDEPTMPTVDNVALASKLRKAASTFIDKAVDDERMEKSRSEQLMTAAGIAIDKVLKLEGVPDVVVEVTVSLYDKMKRYGFSDEQAEKALRDYESVLERKYAQMLTSGNGVN